MSVHAYCGVSSRRYAVRLSYPHGNGAVQDFSLYVLFNNVVRLPTPSSSHLMRWFQTTCYHQKQRYALLGTSAVPRYSTSAHGTSTARTCQGVGGAASRKYCCTNLAKARIPRRVQPLFLHNSLLAIAIPWWTARIAELMRIVLLHVVGD